MKWFDALMNLLLYDSALGVLPSADPRESRRTGLH